MEKNEELNYIEDDKIKLFRFFPNNSNPSELGFSDFEDDYDGAISICLINEDSIIINDSYFKNIKIADISGKEINFLEPRNYKQYNFFPGKKSFFIKDKLIIPELNTNRVLIENSQLNDPYIIDFSKTPLNSFCSISLYHDSIYLTSNYAEYGESKYDIYSIDEGKFYRDNREMFNKLSDYTYSDNDIEQIFLTKKNQIISDFFAEGWVIGYSKLDMENSRVLCALKYDEKDNQYLLLVLKEIR